jgi:tRNA modification GTPase
LPVGAIGLSCRTGEGVGELLAVVTERVRGRVGGMEAPLLTRARHREAVREAVEALDRFIAGASGGLELALLAEDLRLATRAVGRITGAVGVEDVLDRIFATFCIGK